MLFSIFCLLIAIAPTFAMDNDTIIASENTSQVQSDYYFDANIENDEGNGSADNPYKEWNSDRISDNSVVHLNNGEYILNGAKTYKNLTIIGENPEKTIIKYRNAVGFTSNGLISLKNVTILNLRVNVNQNSNLSAVNTIFKESSGVNSVIYTYSYATVVLDNCTFVDNSADYGGAINVKDTKLFIMNSLFSNNHATYCGGAISTGNSEINISNSRFISNYASSDVGGAIFLFDSDFKGNNLEFNNCSALFGGAITSLSSNLYLANSIAKNNKAKYYGGAIYKMYASFELLNSTFENNSASYGGALFADMVDDFKISSNYFLDNNATNTGGAVYSIESDSYYDIVDEHLNNTFKDNHASFDDDVYQSEYLDWIVEDNDYTLMHYNSSYNGTLPDRYDLRDFGFVTPVKNQGNGGNCWAFSAMAALESAILKATNTSYDLSEENMKNIASLYSEYGWAMETNLGGYDRMAIGYLTSWLGPVVEIYDEYNPKSLLSPLFYGFMHVQNIIFLTRDNYTDNDAIKKAIMDYGAVSTSAYWSSSYIGNSRNYYYNGNSASNHAVAIIGWDDNYDASNFKNTPEGNGAWIIKNSWGPSSGENGFFYVSYYDTRLAQIGKYNTYAFILNDTIRYDKNYQYDIPGRTDYFLNVSDTVWYKTRFYSSDDEYLAAVSTYFQKDTNWDLYIYVNDTLKLKQSGFTNGGYRTIDLNSLIPLNDGDVFEIVFKITVDKDAGVPVSEYVSLNSLLYYVNISFISYDGINWVDFYDLEWEYPEHIYYSQVACIKAFTVLNPVNSKIELTPHNIKDDTTDIIARVVDEYGNLIKYGEVTFNVEGVDKIVPVSNGVANLFNVNINEGINRVAARFSAVGYNASSDVLVVSKYPIDTFITLDVLSDYNPFIFKATVMDLNNNPAESGEVTFAIDGMNYTVSVCDGVTVLNHTFKSFGVKNIFASFNDLYCYNGSDANTSITVSNILTSISLSVDGQFNPINITAEVIDSDGMKVNRGAVIFNVSGACYTVEVNDGIASLVNTFNVGLNLVQATYFDEGYVYNSSTCEKSFIVSLKPTSIDLIAPSDAVVYDSVNLTAIVIDQDNNPVKNGRVVFSFDGVNKVVQVVNGKASVSHVFKTTGFKNIFARFIDVYYYENSDCSISFNVSKNYVDLSMRMEKNGRDVNIYLDLSKGIDEYVVVLVNNDSYSVKTNGGHGVIRLTNLSNGEYVVNARIDSESYNSNNQTASFVISETPTNIYCEDKVFYLNNAMYYSAILKDKTGMPISNRKVCLTVDNRKINAVTDSRGSVSFKLNLGVGSYDALVEFGGDYYYLKSNATKSITVKSSIDLPTATKYTFNAKYSFKLLDSQGNPLKNKEVNVTVDDVVYTLTTDSNGNAYYNINLNPGTYQITIANSGTGEVKTQTINVVARIDGNKDLTMYYGAGSSYKVRVYDDNGNVAKNVEVKFTINGKTYSVFSDSNGYSSLKINLNPKTYTIVARYNGYKVSNKVVVKPTLVCYDKTVKRSKTFSYTVKLLNTKGSVLKNKYVVVKFKGKTYKAKTNSKGVATFKLNSPSIGKFALTATYGSAKVSKTITVKK